MTKPSEYMEAFFGVELNQKFEDMINELREIEDNLKELSKDIGKLSTNLGPEETKVLIKECRAVADLHPYHSRTRCLHEDLPDLQVGRF